jgi:hypothetical protein
MDYWLISTGMDREPGIHGRIARKRTDLLLEFM